MRKETGLLHIDLFEFLPKKSTIGLRSRAGGIRTHDLLNPIQALYQAEPRPVFRLLELNGTLANAIAFFRTYARRAQVVRMDGGSASTGVRTNCLTRSSATSGR